MQGRLPFLIYMRLRCSASQLRRIASSSEEALTDTLTVLQRRRPVKSTCKQNPSQELASGFNSTLPREPNSTFSQNCKLKLEVHAEPNPNTVNDANSSFPTSLPEVEKCIWAVERLSKGKEFTKQDKAQNRVPGFVWEQDVPNTNHVLIVMDKFQIQSLLNILGEERFLCTIFTLEVFDGFGSSKILYRERVLPRRINFSKSGEVSNVGYTKAPLGMKLRLDAPIRISGQENCPGLRKGGFLRVYLSYVSLSCVPEELPQYVEIDVNDMDIGDRICVEDLRNCVPLHFSDNQTSLPICEIIKVHT